MSAAPAGGLSASRPAQAVRRAALRLRGRRTPIAQAAVAAALAYLVAEAVLGRDQPFFAPVAAVVCLGVTQGERLGRAVQIVIGVAVGIAVADAIVLVLGRGALTLALVVALAMGVAVAVGGSTLLVNQAAIAAILVVVLGPGEPLFPPGRLLDALVGGVVALAVNAVSGRDPGRAVERAARPLFADLADLLDRIALVLETGDRDGAVAALDEARAIDHRVAEFREAVASGREQVRTSVVGRRGRRALEVYALAEGRVDLTMASGRAFARAAANATRHGRSVAPGLVAATRDLATAFRALSEFLVGDTGPEPARAAALLAGERTTEALRADHRLTDSVLVGHVRSAVVDVLRATGASQEDAVAALERVAGRADDVT